MYDFHKIKNLDGFHEFKHDNFNKDNPESIEFIKRKQNDTQNASQEFSDDRGKVMNEYQKLKKNYKEIEESLNIISD